MKTGLSPHDCLTVNDPHNEVVYRTYGFTCTHKENQFLTEDTIARLLVESNGALIRNTVSSARFGHPVGSVRKRKRNTGSLPKAIAPCVYRTRAGTLYYSVTTESQVTVSGSVVRLPKVKLIKLQAHTLPDAVIEIQKRRLKDLHRSTHLEKRRSLKLLSYLAGITDLKPDDLKYFASVIRRWKQNGGRKYLT